MRTFKILIHFAIHFFNFISKLFSRFNSSNYFFILHNMGKNKLVRTAVSFCLLFMFRIHHFGFTRLNMPFKWLLQQCFSWLLCFKQHMGILWFLTDDTRKGSKSHKEKKNLHIIRNGCFLNLQEKEIYFWMSRLNVLLIQYHLNV